MLHAILCPGLLCTVFDSESFLKIANDRAENRFPPEMLKDNAEGFAMIPTLLHPYSSGRIELRSNNPMDPPIIHPGYLTDERDLETLAAGALKCVEIARQMGYTKIVLNNGKAASPPADSLDTWRADIKEHSATLYHPSSTCSMGKVVDSNLRVKGVVGLRVADASVFPHITSGNTNAPCIMIGEMAADILKTEYGLA